MVLFISLWNSNDNMLNIPNQTKQKNDNDDAFANRSSNKAQPMELLLVLDASDCLADVEQHLDPCLRGHVLLHVPVVGRQLLAKKSFLFPKRIFINGSVTRTWPATKSLVE